MDSTPREEVTRILQDWNDDSPAAAERLMPVAPGELCRLNQTVQRAGASPADRGREEISAHDNAGR